MVIDERAHKKREREKGEESDLKRDK